MPVELEIGLALVLLTLVVDFFYRKIYKNNRHGVIVEGIPLVPDPHWLLGHLKQFISFDLCSSQSHFTFDYANKEGLCSFWKLNVPFVAVTTPKHARALLHASAHRNPSFILVHHLRHFLGPRNIFMMNGREWKFCRSVVHKAFSPTALDAVVSSMNSVCYTLVKSLRSRIDDADGSSINVEVLPLIKMVAIDIFGIVSMGTDFRGCATLKLSPIAKAIDFMSDELTRRASSPFNPFNRFYNIPSKLNIRHRRERCFLRNLLDMVIKSRREELSKSDEDKSQVDLLSHLLNAFRVQKENGESREEKYSDDNFADLFLSLLFAGYETTSITVTYALYCVAKHPKVEARCLRELQSVLGRAKDHDCNSNKEDVPLFDPKKLVYCRAVILETLRLYPPVTTLSRCLQQPMGIGGVKLPKGIRVFLHLWSIQRDERNFPRPLEFIPERWVIRYNYDTDWQERNPDQNCGDDGGKQTCDDVDQRNITDKDENGYVPPGDPNALFAFSSGARICAGRKLALQEIVIILAVLLWNLKFKLLMQGYHVKPCMAGLVQIPSDNLPMIILRR